MRENPGSDRHVKIGEALFGDALILPQYALGMGETDRGGTARSHTRALFFEADLFGRLVFTQTFERSLAKQAIGAPAAVFDVGNQLRRNPSHVLENGARDLIGKARHLAREAVELPSQGGRLVGREACSSTASMDQPAAFVVA
jgi:hypothetical protein